MQNVRKIGMDAYAYLSDRFPSAEVEGIFGRVFKNFSLILEKTALEELLSMQSRREANNFLIIDAYALQELWADATVKERLPSFLPCRILVLYDREAKELLPEFVEQGIRNFFPYPWGKEEIRLLLKPMVQRLQQELRLNELEKQKSLMNRQKAEYEGVTDCEELYERTRNLEGFFRLESKEFRTLSDELTNLSSMVLQTDLSERQKNYMAKMHQLILELGRLSKELNNRVEFLENPSGNGKRSFNINSVLDLVAELTEKVGKDGELRLVYDIDNSVPAMLYGDPILLGQALSKILGLFVELDGRGEIVVHVSLESIPGNGREAELRFRVEEVGETLSHEQKSRLYLQMKDRLEIARARKWVESMGGSFALTEDTEEGLLAFSIPVKSTDRRSYRLPSKAWMNKKVLVVTRSSVLSEALSKMLGYFHFPVTRAGSRAEVLKALHEESFDMIFVDEAQAEALLEEIVSTKHEARLILLSDDPEKSRHHFEKLLFFIDDFLENPCQQEKIFNTILSLFARDSLDGTRETLEILKENLSFLAEGKRVLFVGENDSDWSLVKEMLRDSGVAVKRVEAEENLRSHAALSELTILGGRMPEESWKELLGHCREQCDLRRVIALVPEEESDKRKEAESSSISKILPSPINPEQFYRLLLESLLG